jgi:type VI secretion system protein ImpH
MSTSQAPLAQLQSAPAKFDFFQAVRLLERLAAERGGVALGGDAAPDQEALRCQALTSLRFPEGPVAKLTPASNAGPPRLWAAFGGLTGPDGILPQHYTALILARQRLKDTTLRDWLDLFHHRILSLFMRAWEKNRWPAVLDRAKAECSTHPSAEARRDAAATTAAYSFAGYGTPGLRGRLSLPDEVAVYYSGFLSRLPRSAVGLQQVLEDYFEWPAAVEQLCGQWLYLDEENKAGMPTATAPGRNTCLGRDVVIGRRVWDVQSKVRVIVGPVDGSAFRSLLPDGDARRPFGELVRLSLGLEPDVEVQIVLAPDAVPWSALEYDEANGPRLGWNTWVRTHNFGTPVGDVRFAVE